MFAQYINSKSNLLYFRYYIQPQWVFDSVNSRELLPVNKYFAGEVLPPHLSPFVDKDRDPYQQYVPPEEAGLEDPSLLQATGVEDESESGEEVGLDNEPDAAQKLSVKPGKLFKEDPGESKRQEYQERKLREKMVKNKHRKLYKSMKQGKLERSKEVWLLKKKRKLIEEEKKATESQ